MLRSSYRAEASVQYIADLPLGIPWRYFLSNVITLDGHSLIVEHSSAAGPSGRSALLERLRSHAEGIVDPVNEMRTVGMWPDSSARELVAWVSAAPMGEFIIDPERELRTYSHHFDVRPHPARLRSPLPIDLLQNMPEVELIRPADGHPPYEGPPVLWRWVHHLTSRIAADRYRLGVTHAYLSRETNEAVLRDPETKDDQHSGLSYIHKPSFGSQNPILGVSDDVIDCYTVIPQDRDRYDNVRGGPAALTYLVPIESIAAISLDLEYSEVRPLFGKEVRALFDTRGYGPLTQCLLNIWFSDGWRLCELHLRFEAVGLAKEESMLQALTRLIRFVAARRLATAAGLLSAAEVEELTALSAIVLPTREPTQRVDAASQSKVGKFLEGNPFVDKREFRVPCCTHFGLPSDSPLLAPA